VRPTRHFTIVFWLVLVFAGMNIRSSRATIYFAQSIAQLAAQSDVIVLGRVDSTESHWLGGRIVTDALVLVEQSIKGDAVRVLDVTQPGGKVGNIAMRQLEAAQFRTGDRAILFLKHAEGRLRVAGLSQGKLDVVSTSSGEIVRMIPAGKKMPERVTLESALEQLRAVVRAR
jgi:hypothetical protein